METRSVTWLLIGAITLLAVSPVESARFAVGEDVRNDNDFGKSANSNRRWDVENGTLDGSLQDDEINVDVSNSAADGTETDGTEPTYGTETFEKTESVNETGIKEDLKEVDGEVVPEMKEEAGDSTEEDGSDALTRRKKRARPAEIPQVTSYARSIVGKTFNFNNLTKLTKNVQLTFSGKLVNLAQFKIEPTDAVKLENFLRGELLPERLYVVTKLAGMEQAIAKAQRKMITTLAIEDLDDKDNDIVLTPEDVDELQQSIKDDSSILDLNAPVKLTNAIQSPSTTSAQNLTVPSGATNKDRVKRKVTSSNSLKWPTTIPYVITSDFNSLPTYISAIKAAAQHWADETCLIFNKVNFYSGSHLKFERKSGCWSKIGRRGGGHTISIGYGCGRKAIVAHEIGHALGFWHEQSRPDRSMYVNIHSGNIKPGRYHNFARKSWNDVLALGIPYDYSSVMHYGTHYFSKNGQKTISAKEADMDRTLGSRFGLSFYDVKLANYRYCLARCIGGLTWSRCRNDGYRDPKNCNKCKCPDGWTGTYCTVVDSPVNASCGSMYLTATSTWKTLSSPYYVTSGLPANSQCTWRIRAYGYYRQVVMQFIDDFKVQSYCPRTCTNYVEVRHQDLARTGPRYCCSRPTKYFRSHGTTRSINDMLVLMRIVSASGLKGFKLRYKYETCGGYSSQNSMAGPACVDTQAYTCYGPYYVKCGFLSWSRCRRQRTSTCYRQVKRCYYGFRLIGSWCYRTWSKWSSWSSCSKSCGACGVRTRTRTCLRPRCSGSNRQTLVCNKQACPLITKRCRESYRCGGWWSNRRTCYRYKICTVSPKCCAGRRLIGNQCF